MSSIDDTLAECRNRHQSSNKFEVVCSPSNRGKLQVVETGMTYYAAFARAEELQAESDARHENKSSWTKPLFWARIVKLRQIEIPNEHTLAVLFWSPLIKP